MGFLKVSLLLLFIFKMRRLLQRKLQTSTLNGVFQQDTGNKWNRSIRLFISYRFLFATLIILSLGVIILTCNIYHLHNHQNNISSLTTKFLQIDKVQPIAWVYGKNLHTGYLNHVIDIFGRIGYKIIFKSHDNKWDILWAHDYPFADLSDQLKNLKPHQKVNHFPGSGFITNKVNLATIKSPFVPMAFKMPNDKDLFLNYAQKYPDELFVQKNNKHRGIQVETVASVNLTQDGSFIQKFIKRPLLIDNRKFDIGIYTIVTSIDPLRVYIYNGDVLLRFCSEDYYPFDANIIEKYVVGDAYTPIWEMPSLKFLYENMGYTMKETFNAYFIKRNKNPNIIWTQIKNAISEIILVKEPKFILASQFYKTNSNFFEMVRFDFAVDENFKVYVMEANMSPNLSSSHFSKNKLMYEQVIFNTVSLIGALHFHLHGREDESMAVSTKDLMVNAITCQTKNCQHINNCLSEVCQLCQNCLNEDWKVILIQAYKEHRFKHNCGRIFPPSMLGDNNWTMTIESLKGKLSNNNRQMLYWFQGKCRQDVSFC